MVWILVGLAVVCAIGWFVYRAVKWQGVKAETVDKEWHG